jgi:hypothetical protein
MGKAGLPRQVKGTHRGPNSCSRNRIFQAWWSEQEAKPCFCLFFAREILIGGWIVQVGCARVRSRSSTDRNLYQILFRSTLLGITVYLFVTCLLFFIAAVVIWTLPDPTRGPYTPSHTTARSGARVVEIVSACTAEQNL